MREQIVRLSGAKQELGLGVLLLSLVAGYQTQASPSWLAGAMTGSLALLLLGAGTIIWAAEERARGNRAFSIGFLLLGLAVVAVGVRGILIYARA